MVMNPDFNPKQIELRAEEARREHERERRALQRSARPKAASSSLLARLRHLLGR